MTFLTLSSSDVGITICIKKKYLLLNSNAGSRSVQQYILSLYSSLLAIDENQSEKLSLLIDQ